MSIEMYEFYKYMKILVLNAKEVSSLFALFFTESEMQ